MRKSFTSLFSSTVFSRWLLPVIICCFLFPFSSYSQTGAVKLHDFYKNAKPEDYKFYGGDTLKDFDLKGTFEAAKAMNCSSTELYKYMMTNERIFLFGKYREVLKNSHYHDPLRLISRYGEKDEPSQADKDKGITKTENKWLDNTKKTLAHKPQAGGCNNIDFSDPAPFTNWTGGIGVNNYSNSATSVFAEFGNWLFSTATLNAQYITPPASGTPITLGKNAGLNSCSWVTICTKGTDSCGNFPMVCPGFTASCRLGGDFVNLDPGIGGGFAGCGERGNIAYDASTGLDTDQNGTAGLIGGAYAGGHHQFAAQGEVMEQSIPITSANDLLTINYAAVLNDGGHPTGEEPFVFFAVYDQTGAVIPCLEYYQEAVAGSFPPGFSLGKSLNWIQNTVANGGGNYQTPCYYKPWTTVAFDMTPYIGTTVTFQAIACGCWPGGHFAYCYIDLTCGKLQLPVVNTSCGNGTITAPAGAASYKWTGPCISGSSTNQSVNVTCSGTYSCTVNLTGTAGCNFVIDTAITISSNPTITASAVPSSICSGGAGTTLSASGAGGGGTYSWTSNPPGFTSSSASVSVNPSVTTTYSVVGTTSGLACSGSKTVVVTVTTTPTVNITSPPPTICSGNSTVITATGATTYSWSPAIGATTSTVSVSPGSTTTYTVTGTNGACTSAPQTIVVTVNPSPTITASGSTTICSGNSTVISASGATTYNWSPGIGVNTSTVSVSPGSTTTYTVTGTTAGCTSGPQTVTVTVTPTPTVTASAGSPTICSGSSTTLTASGAATYTWTPGGSTGSTLSVSPGTTSTYTVTGSNGACGSGSQNVVVTVTPTPTVTLSAPPTICSGNSTTLTASGASTYFWLPGFLSGSTVSVSPGSTTTYTVTGTASGCTSAPKTVVVTVNPTPTLTISGPVTVCAGSSTTLTGGGASTYQWQPGALTTSTISVTPASTTTYTLTGSSAAACPAAPKTVVVTVSSVPTVTVSAGPSTICSGSSSTLTASGATTYTWTPGGLTGSTVSVSPGTTATYTVIGTLTGCSNSAPATVVVTVNPTPTVSASAAPATICSGNSTVLKGSGATTYVWMPGFLSGSTVSVSPGSTTTYSVIGTTSGCSNVIPATVVVTVNPTPTITPSAGPASICSGGSTTLTGGGATTYTWTPGGLTGSTISVSPGTTTTYTVNGTKAGCNSASPGTVIVTVTATPTINVSPVSPIICPGGNVNLIATGATTYTWTPSATLSASTGSSVTASPAGSTTYTITGNSGACPSAPVTEVVTVAAKLNVTVTPPNPAICAGGNVTLNAGGAATYVWSPSIGLSCSTCSNPTASPADTTTYKVVGSSGSCKDSANVTVIVNPNPTPTITLTGISAAICPGDSMGMIASGATTYVWTPSTGLSCSTCVTISASPTVTTTYTLTGSNATGCSGTASQAIVVYPLPNMTLNITAANLCMGDSINLLAAGVSSYSWSPPAGLNTTLGDSVIATPTVTTTYVVTGTGTGGCKTKDTAVLTVNPLPVVVPTATDSSICTGGSGTTLNASGGSNYVWSPGALSGSPVNVNPASTTTYSVIGTNTVTGCSNTGTIIITVNTTPTVTISLSGSGSDTVCSGQAVVLTANGSATSYVWSNGSTTSSISVVPNSDTIYSVIASNGSCGSASVSQPVFVFPPLSLTMITDSVCAGKHATVTVLASGGEPAYIYAWSNGVTGVNTINVIPFADTAFACTVTDACGSSRTDTGHVIAYVTPNISFTANPKVIQGGQFVGFVNTTTGATGYYWTLGNGSTSTDVNPYEQYLDSGAYVVTLIANNAGCKDTLSDTIYVTETIFIPNVFTPNGDGQNDVFHVTMTSMKTYSLEIFNRWGQRVFISNSPDMDWDGRSEGGVEAADGDYYYILLATDYAGKNFKYHGYLQLIR